MYWSSFADSKKKKKKVCWFLQYPLIKPSSESRIRRKGLALCLLYTWSSFEISSSNACKTTKLIIASRESLGQHTKFSLLPSTLALAGNGINLHCWKCGCPFYRGENWEIPGLINNLKIFGQRKGINFWCNCIMFCISDRNSACLNWSVAMLYCDF